MLKRIIRASLLVGALITACFLAFTLIRGQEGTVQLLASAIKGQHARDKVREAMTPGRFRVLQGLCAIVIMVLFLLFRQAGRLSDAIGSLVRDMASLIRDAWRTAMGGPGKWLLVIPLLMSLYGLLFIPLNFDEALTYFDFTTRGPLVTMTYYPYPNNHVLHSLLTNFTRFLPLPALVDLRIMPVAVTLLANLLCLHLMTRLYGSRTAWVITAVSTTLFFSLYYSYMSRGYYLVWLFFLVAFYSAERISRGDAEAGHRKAFVLCSILGFFTMPSYLYPFVTLCIYMVIRRPSSIRSVFLMGLITVPVVLFLYMPIMVVSGPSALISNPYVKPIGRAEVWKDLPGFLGSALTEMTGFHWIWAVSLLLIAAIHTLLHRQREHLRDMIFFLAMPLLIMLGHSVIPFPRTFSYYVVLLVILVFIPYAKYLSGIGARPMLTVLLIVQLLFCWRFFDLIRPYEERDPQVNMTAWDINRNIMGDKKYFCAGTLMGTNLRFELETRFGYKDHITFRDRPVDADTLKGYDHIIVGRLLDSTRNRRPEYASPYFTVYDGKTDPAQPQARP